MGKLKDIEKFKHIRNYEEWMHESVKVPIEQMRITNDPEIKVLLENMSDDELQKHWIDYERISKMPEYGNPLSFQMVWSLEEAHYATYPIDKTIEYIKKYFDLPDEWVKKKIGLNDGERIVVTIPIAGNNLEQLKKAMLLCGWYYAAPSEDKITPNQLQKIQFEPIIYSDDSKQIRSEETTLLHLTPYFNWGKIKHLGFSPRCKNGMFNYPDRVYFFRGSTPIEDIKNLASEMMSEEQRLRSEGRYVLITIDLNKVPDDIKLSLDQNYEYGVHTKDNIHPDAIIGYEEIKI